MLHTLINFTGMDLFTDCYIEMWKGNLVIKKYGRSPKILHGDKFHNTAEVINIDRQKNTAKKYG